MVLPLAIPVAKLGEMLILAGIAYFSAKAVVDNAPAISKAVDSAINSDEAADDADKADAPPITDTCSACQPPEESPQDDQKKQNQINKEKELKKNGKDITSKDAKAKNYELDSSKYDANKIFDEFEPKDVKNYGNGIRSGKLEDGRNLTIRPKSDAFGAEPTIDIRPPSGEDGLVTKYRFR